MSNELSIDIPDAFDLLDKVELPLVDGTPSTGTLVDANSGVLFKYVPAASALKTEDRGRRWLARSGSD